MSDWNDVLTVLTHDPAIRTWTPLPGTTRTVQATIATENHNEIAMVIDNSTNEDWLQFMVTISDTTNGVIWENTGWHLRHTPAIGLAQLGDSIVLRHSILLPHAAAAAITNGITLTTTAATALFNATLNQPGPTPYH